MEVWTADLPAPPLRRVPLDAPPLMTLRRTLCALAALVMIADAAHAQLRIVQYNTATAQNPGTQTARSGMDFVLQAIGQELVNFTVPGVVGTQSVARPIDVIALQEQYTTAISTQSFVNLLNSIYGAGTYARGTLDGDTSDGLRRAGAPALIYNTQTVQLIGEMKFGDVGSNDGVSTFPAQQPRSSMRYQLRPVGYTSTADFYVYSLHLKSDTGTAENNRRLVEAQAVRANADALGDGVHAIYSGDFNIQSTGSTAYQHFRSAGNGQAIDPLNQAGASQTWNNSSTYAAIHTQSPALSSRFSGQTLGGLDDRFDFQLVTGELMDNEGMSLLTGSYHPFGNNGSTFNSDLDNSSNTYPFSGVTFSGANTRSQLLTNLASVSDHLPVVADYQVPAILNATLASSIAPSYGVGSTATVDVLVKNLANASVVYGADELDYSYTVSGDLIGSGSGMDLALGGGNLHAITLNTTTPGAKSGTITVTTASQGAANPLVTIPVNYFVGTFDVADFNQNGFVNAADLAIWQGAFGTTAAGDANADAASNGSDFLIWQRHFTGGGSIAAVPEPASMALALLGVSMVGRRVRRSRR